MKKMLFCFWLYMYESHHKQYWSKLAGFQGMRQRDEDLAKEVELLRQKLAEIEQIARGRGLAGVFNLRHGQAEEAKPTPVAWSAVIRNIAI